jgi:hypothetical protein
VPVVFHPKFCAIQVEFQRNPKFSGLGMLQNIGYRFLGDTQEFPSNARAHALRLTWHMKHELERSIANDLPGQERQGNSQIFMFQRFLT